MRELIVKELEANQRLDKYLHKYLKEAPNSFLYKMMRKKNIVLNGKKVTGNEILQCGDSVRLFLADETIDKFRGNWVMQGEISLYEKAYLQYRDIKVIAEYEDVLFIEKPSGVLSQRFDNHLYSANEWLIGYLLKTRALCAEDLKTFKPSVCNRLDRNTSGLLICSKTLLGSQVMGQLLKDRTLHKYYLCMVKGHCDLDGMKEAYIYKDEKNNKVTVFESCDLAPLSYADKLKPIKTGIKVLAYQEEYTLLEIELFTGKSHQIRAHMEHLGYPLVGDVKYGGNENVKHTDGQILHAYKLVFPKMTGPLSYLSEKEIICEKRFVI